MRVNNWLSGFACVLLLGVVGCKKDKIREGIPVVVEKVGVDDVEIFGDYVGRIRARQFVEVHARVEGYLEKMLFEEGKRVERNQPLFIINPDLYKARADKAAAQLKKDEAQELKTGRDVERLRPLYEQNAASQLDLDNAIAAYESAKANVGTGRDGAGIYDGTFAHFGIHQRTACRYRYLGGPRLQVAIGDCRGQRYRVGRF